MKPSIELVAIKPSIEYIGGNAGRVIKYGTPVGLLLSLTAEYTTKSYLNDFPKNIEQVTIKPNLAIE